MPKFPRCLGIITSPQAAALRDVLSTLKRRMPTLPIVIYPTPVQGEGAGGRIARAIELANARGECDVLIVCRGGGSIEDLWAYNDESLARAICASAIPVVSGVGHETDFTIADFVSDVRAATPTAAAALVTADRLEVCQQLKHMNQRLSRIVQRELENRMQRLDYLERCLIHPGDRLAAQLQHLAHLGRRLRGEWDRFTQSRAWSVREVAHALRAARPDIRVRTHALDDRGRRLHTAVHLKLDDALSRMGALDAHLKHLNPDRVLDRGYAIAIGPSGDVVHRADQISAGDEVNLRFGRGWATADVRTTSSESTQ